MIPQNVLDVHDERGGPKDDFIVTYNGHFTDGIDFEAECIWILNDEGLDVIAINELDPSKFAIYKKI